MNSMTMTKSLFYDRLQTNVGDLIVAMSEEGLKFVNFADPHNPSVPAGWIHDPAKLENATSQLREYLNGGRHTFDLPLAPAGTPFQRRVWQALTEIPYGRTISYRELAQQVESPRGFRAVGNANGRNPIVIIQPCHRVIAMDGKIGGFSSGIHRKKYLLEMEGVHTL